MKLHTAALPLLVLLKTGTAEAARDLCLGSCGTNASGAKECTFNVELNLFAGELGYYQFAECEGTNPTLGVEKGVTYRFVQGDITNYYHPFGLAYYPDGAHDDVDELEPGIAPPGSSSGCADSLTCPAPMYIKGGEYLGEYSNNADIAPEEGAEDFGLDFYEPEFFLDPITWATAGTYEVALKFDVDDFVDDIFYFCHIHQFMSGRIKFVDDEGNCLNEDDVPPIPYAYDMPSAYDQSCGTYGLEDFQLPNAQCPETFVCNKPDDYVGDFAGCLDSMDCAMMAGMTTNANQDSAIALFNHQMIPHHQNAVNMCKALMNSGELDGCTDITDEEDQLCVMTVLCYEIINGQNFQIQTMRGVLDSLDYAESDDCVVIVDEISSSSEDGGDGGHGGGDGGHGGGDGGGDGGHGGGDGGGDGGHGGGDGDGGHGGGDGGDGGHSSSSSSSKSYKTKSHKKKHKSPKQHKGYHTRRRGL